MTFDHPPNRTEADLTALAQRVGSGEQRAVDALDECLSRAQGPAARHVFVRRFDAQARVAAQAIDQCLHAGLPAPPLAGLAISVKDLLDVAGHPTTAASQVLSGQPPAREDAPAVARVRRAGGVLVGHTNMTEFAFSGIGLNPHHGTPANPVAALLDDAPRIPGGSTSGGAVSVAIGAAHAALGSDTGGSLRIPAAFHGLVGYKSTARLVSTAGCIPLSQTLDTIGAITRSVRDAVRMHEILADRPVALQGRPARRLRLAHVRTTLLDTLDEAVARTWSSTLSALSGAGAEIVEVDMPALAPDHPDFACLTDRGGLSAAESWAWHRELLERDGARYDPRVAWRIRRGAALSASDYLDMLAARRRWMAAVQHGLQGFDAALSPTVAIIPPTIASLARDDDFFRTNALVLRNTAVVNLLDGCAISLPCNHPGDWPVGLSLWAAGGQDDVLLDAARAVESVLTTR